jgi:hypothetical protein
MRNGRGKGGWTETHKKKRHARNAKRAAAAAGANGEDERGAKREPKEGTEVGIEMERRTERG